MQLAPQVQWVASVGGLDVQNDDVCQSATWINACVCVCACVFVRMQVRANRVQLAKRAMLCSAACNTQTVQC